MAGSVVSWGLGAVLAAVVSVAVLRTAGAPSGARLAGAANQRSDAFVHASMAMGMCAMLAPGGTALRGPLTAGFAAMSLASLLSTPYVLLRPGDACRAAGRGAAPRAGHRLHHAAMLGIMALMAHVPASPMAIAHPVAMTADMAMPSPAHGGSPLLTVAFCYATASACVFTWRLPGLPGPGPRRGSCAADPLGRSCEIVMLVSTAVMLLPAM